MFIQQLVNGFMIGTVYSLIGVGFSLIFGVVRILNFAYGEFFMIASYAAFIGLSTLSLPLWLVFIVNFVLLFILGFLTEKLLIKPMRSRTDADGEHSGIIIVTFGLQVILQSLALLLFKGTYRGIDNYTRGTISFGPVTIGRERLFMTVASIIILAAILIFMKWTRIGSALRAVSQNRSAAQISGINVNSIYAIAFGLSTSLAAIAGTLLLPFYSAYPTVGMLPMGKAFSVTLIGGLGSIGGAILAGPILGILESLAAGYISAQAKEAVAFACVILVLIVFPGGLGDLIRQIAKKLRGARR